MNKKIIGATLLIVTLTFTSVFAFAGNNTVKNNSSYDANEIVIWDEGTDGYEVNTAAELLKELEDEGIKVSDDDVKKITTLYNKIIPLEKTNKFDEACELWNQLYIVLDTYYDYEFDIILDTDYNYEVQTAEEFLKEEFGENIKISDEDIVKITTLYDNITLLEDADKFDETEKLWEQLNNILNTYYNFEILTGEEFLKQLTYDDIKISVEDTVKITTIYNEIIVLEEAEKFEETDVLWEAFDKIYNSYFNY
jgi:hypothetical protein